MMDDPDIDKMTPILNQKPKLNDRHRQMLLDSGIAPDVIEQREYGSIVAGKNTEWLNFFGYTSFDDKIGLFVPLRNAKGYAVNAQVRVDNVKAWGGVRYFSARQGEGNRNSVVIDIPRKYASELKNSKVALWITEGAKKADAATSVGILCIALQGVNSIKYMDAASHTVQECDEWEDILLKGRTVYICFDNDVMVKDSVQKALRNLIKFLTKKEANVKTVYLPMETDDKGELVKIGLDDYIAQGHNEKDLYALPQEKPKKVKEAVDTSDPELLEELNNQIAILHNPVGFVLYKKDGLDDLTGKVPQITKTLKLKDAFAHIAAPDDKKHVITWWTEQENKRVYNNVVMKPGNYCDPNDFNYWAGWKYSPRHNDEAIEPFWTFVREVICDNDEKRYDWLRKFLGHMVQKTWEIPRITLVIVSGEGTGKTFFVDYLIQLFNRNTFISNSLDQAYGKFTSHLATAILVYLNESIWGGNVKQIGALKASITDNTLPMEEKGVPIITIENYRRTFITSNESNPVHMGPDTRRFIVFQVSEKYKNNKEYWLNMHALLDNDEAHEALMYDLMQEDIEGFTPDFSAVKNNMFEYKMENASQLEHWLWETLQSGMIAGKRTVKTELGENTHQCYTVWKHNCTLQINKDIFYNSYAEFAKNSKQYGYVYNQMKFWRTLRKIFKDGVADNVKQSRVRVEGSQYLQAELPDLNRSKILFSKFFEASLEETRLELDDESADTVSICPNCQKPSEY